MSTNAGPIDLSNSWGSTLAAVFVSLVFYGISILQTFLYYERYTEDTVILKSLVAWVFILDTLHTVLISLGVWQYFVLHFGDDRFLQYTHAPLLISIVVTSAISSSVQSFFIYRIWFFIKNRYRWLVPAILMPFVVAQMVLGTFYTVVALGFQTSVSAVSGPLLTKVANALNGAAMAVDIAITISLCTLLAMGRTGFADTDQVVFRLIFISVNTGLSSALFAFLSVLLLVIYPTDLIFTAFYYPLGTVYCNTLLASLNARSFARRGRETRKANTVTSLVWQQQHLASVDQDADTRSKRTEIGGSAMEC